MTAEVDLGGRLPLLAPGDLDPEQRRFYDDAMAGQHPASLRMGFQLVTTETQLIGPYNAFLRHPEVAEKFQDFAGAATAHSTLSPHLREVVILAVGSAWESDYEVYAHEIIARTIGVGARDAEAMAAGRSPAELGYEATLAFTVVRQLTLEHRIEASLYDEALTAFGERGLFDIAALMGAYHTVSTVLNLFDVPAP